MKIAISSRYVSDPIHRRMYITFPYKEIAEELGWFLIPIVSTDHIDEIAEMCDVLIVPGNTADVHPDHYGEELQPETTLYDYSVYEQDEAAIHAFDRLGKPILGICAGIQVINVVFGGSLHQDIKNHMGQRHHLKLEPGSRLFNIYGKEDIITNSFHHQCIKRLAEGFKVTAISDDGIIEGIEKDNILAVQWHPEMDHDLTFFRNCFK